MGRDKTLLEIGGKTLIERAASLCEPLVTSVTLVGDSQRITGIRFPALADRWPGAGPLGAIATALGAAQQPWCLVLACDMPNVSVDWLEWLLVHATKTYAAANVASTIVAGGIVAGANVDDAIVAGAVGHGVAVGPDAAVVPDAFIPETSRGLEPLCAVYRAACAPVLSAALNSGVRKVTDGLDLLNTEIITEKVWRKFSADGDLFQNLNTWEDYVKAKKRLES